MRHRGNRRGSRTPATVANVLEKTLSAYRLDQKLQEYAAFPEWPQIVGEDIARVAFPVKILSGKTLVVRVVDAAWAQELSFQKSWLIDRIFDYGMGAVIEDIRFVTGSPKPRK